MVSVLYYKALAYFSQPSVPHFSWPSVPPLFLSSILLTEECSDMHRFSLWTIANSVDSINPFLFWPKGIFCIVSVPVRSNSSVLIYFLSFWVFVMLSSMDFSLSCFFTFLKLFAPPSPPPGVCWLVMKIYHYRKARLMLITVTSYSCVLFIFLPALVKHSFRRSHSRTYLLINSTVHRLLVQKLSVLFRGENRPDLLSPNVDLEVGDCFCSLEALASWCILWLLSTALREIYIYIEFSVLFGL